ncbi:MAG: acyltransferase family protein [Actinomycetota bacterium]|nr:acyltransferase family protein [Actinomycetota bacterium]
MARSDIGRRGCAPLDPGPRLFRADVQGLRGVAIALVVAYHLSWVVTGGYVGVDVFFVISGFLITSQLLHELEKQQGLSFIGFYARRARRILPAATIVLIATVLCARAVLSPQAADRVFEDAVAAVFYGANFRFAASGANYFNSTLPPSPLLHYWSLGVEEQFYLLWPLVLVGASLVWLPARRRAARPPALGLVAIVLGAIALASFLVGLRQTTTSPSWAYYSILTRCWELAIGALAALGLPLWSHLTERVAAGLGWAGVVAIGASALAYSSRTPFPGLAALLPVAGAFAVIVAGSHRRIRYGAEALLGCWPLRRLGDWSYSLYLWHWPAIVLAPSIFGGPLSEWGQLGVLAFSVTAAGASYGLVEQPIRHLRIVVRRPRLAAAGALVLASCSLAVVGTAASTLPSLVPTGATTRPGLAGNGRLTPAQLSVDLEQGVATTVVPSNLTPTLAHAADAFPLIVTDGCHLQRAGTESRPCTYGDRSSKVTVVLFGDSHAAAWFPALRLLSEEHHWRLVDLTKAGCPPVEVAIASYPQCTTWRTNALAQIAALHPTVVVSTWARYVELPESGPLANVAHLHTSAWDNGLVALFSALRADRSTTVFISDTPTLSDLVPDCVSGHLSDAAACTTPRAAAIKDLRAKREELAIAKRYGATTIDPMNWFCTATRCPVIVGNILLYRDDAHMTPQWSEFIAPVLGDDLVPVVAAASRR